MEGYCQHMYLDVKRLVTTGVGNLIHDVNDAIKLPWQHPDGRFATDDEVRACHRLVMTDMSLNPRDGGAQYAKLPKNALRISKAAVDTLVRYKLLENDAILNQRFPQAASWPADAIMAIHSWMWACGPHETKWPRFLAAAAKSDFMEMAKEATFKNNPKRTAATKQLLLNAAKVVAENLCRECLLGQEAPAKAA